MAIKSQNHVIRLLFDSSSYFITNCFFLWGVISLSPHIKLEDHPLSAVRDYSFSYSPYLEAVSYIRIPRTRHIMLRKAHITRFLVWHWLTFRKKI